MSEPTETKRMLRLPHLAVVGGACLLLLSTCALGSPTNSTSSISDIGAASPFNGQEEAPPLPSLPDSRPVDGSGQPIDGSTPRDAVDPEDLLEADGEDAAFSPVETLQPTVRLVGEEPAVDDLVGAVLDVEGVQFATSIEVGELPLAAGGEPTTVETAIIEPQGFRVFTPQITADATDVWDRIVDGDMAFTHDTGQQLELELGERLPAGGDDDRVRVGAFASNGIPPVADAIISREAADDLGFGGAREVLVSLHADADAGAVAAALGDATGMDPEPIVPPETQEADAGATGQQGGVPAHGGGIEPFTYQSIGDGMIRIDPSWVQRNIVSAQVPVFTGAVTCHRAMIPQLRAALQEIVDRGLDEHINPREYGGCWVPRHIMFNPSRNLSMHAWGLAVDFNVPTNQYGAQPQMHPGIVEVFKKWGFAWGGDWSTPDGMHFELRTLMNVQ